MWSSRDFEIVEGHAIETSGYLASETIESKDARLLKSSLLSSLNFVLFLLTSMVSSTKREDCIIKLSNLKRLLPLQWK